jgi:hypothetical protein
MPDNEYLKCLKSEVLRVKRKSKNEFKQTKNRSYFRKWETTSFCLAIMIKWPFQKFERNSRLNENHCDP